MNHIRRLFYFLIFTFLLLSCNEEDQIGVTRTFRPHLDATIINSDPPEIHNYFNGSQGKEIRVGWNDEGKSMRSFINFDLNDILPSYNQELTIDSAVFRVYEANTRLLPFQGNRSVLVSLINSRVIREEDFDTPIVALCGIIASNSYGVLNEYILDVTEVLNSYINSTDGEVEKLTFRLQFTSDGNISNPDQSSLDGSSWSIFAREDDGGYTAALEIKYSLIKL